MAFSHGISFRYALAVLLALLVSSVSAGLYGANSNVVQLDSSNFQKTVMKSSDVWMLEFYAPWCGHCKNLAPAWEAASTKLQGVVNVGAVNCDEDKNRQLCGQYQIQGFPTIKYAVPDEKGKMKVDDYRGERTAAAIAQYASRIIPNRVQTVTSSSYESFVEAAGDSAYALLFTPKSTPTASFKALSLHFKNRLPLGMVVSTDSLVCSFQCTAEQLEVSDFPSLVVFDGEDRVLYDGKMKPMEIRKFLNQYASGPSSAGSEAKPTPPPPEQKPVTSIEEIVDQKSLDELCYSKRICALGLLDKENTDEEEHQRHVDTLLAAAKKNAKTARFAWLDASRFPSFAADLDVSPNYPQLVVLSPAKKGVSQMIGAFSEEKMSFWINAVLSGKKRLYPTDKLPALD